jgi:hypothetical protein
MRDAYVLRMIRRLGSSDANNDRVEMMAAFSSWPIAKQIASCSIIARADRTLVNGIYKATIVEIMKQTPGVVFKYKVGDHFPPADQRAEANTEYGDGVLLLFTGRDAEFQTMIAIYNGRLATAGRTSLDEVRAMLVATK